MATDLASGLCRTASLQIMRFLSIFAIAAWHVWLISLEIHDTRRCPQGLERERGEAGSGQLNPRLSLQL